MAEHQTVTFPSKPLGAKQKEQDFEEHKRTYGAFMKLTKWSIIAIVVLLIVLYFWLVH